MKKRLLYVISLFIATLFIAQNCLSYSSHTAGQIAGFTEDGKPHFNRSPDNRVLEQSGHVPGVVATPGVGRGRREQENTSFGETGFILRLDGTRHK